MTESQLHNINNDQQEIQSNFNQQKMKGIVFGVGIWTAIGSPSPFELKYPSAQTKSALTKIQLAAIHKSNVLGLTSESLDDAFIEDSMRKQRPGTTYKQVIKPDNRR